MGGVHCGRVNNAKQRVWVTWDERLGVRGGARAGAARERRPAARCAGARPRGVLFLQVEQLLWRVLRHYAGRQAARPAVVVLSSTYVVQEYTQPVRRLVGWGGTERT